MTIEKLVAEKIKGNDVVERYVSAVTKRLFAEIAKEDPSTSQDNLEFFKNVKAIFPAFEWKEEDEMGFSVEE